MRTVAIEKNVFIDVFSRITPFFPIWFYESENQNNNGSAPIYHQISKQPTIYIGRRFSNHNEFYIDYFDVQNNKFTAVFNQESGEISFKKNDNDLPDSVFATHHLSDWQKNILPIAKRFTMSTYPGMTLARNQPKKIGNEPTEFLTWLESAAKNHPDVKKIIDTHQNEPSFAHITQLVKTHKALPNRINETLQQIENALSTLYLNCKNYNNCDIQKITSTINQINRLQELLSESQFDNNDLALV